MLTKSAATEPIQKTTDAILDPQTDADEATLLLHHICSDDTSLTAQVVRELRSRTNQDHAAKELTAKRKELEQMIQLLQDGPLRMATYIASTNGTQAKHGRRASVLLENGDTAMPAVPNPEVIERLVCGDAVLLDTQARAIVQTAPPNCVTGEIAELERRLDDERVQLKLNDHTSEAYRAAQTLKDKLDVGQVEPGARLLVCTRRRFAFDAVPDDGSLLRYRFLETGPVPDVIADRDIGYPPPYISELIEHVRSEMEDSQLGRRYRTRAMQTRLLKGVTGTGKTLSILAVIRGIYDVISQLTGAPLEAIPQRVLRLRAAHYLSKWLGDSDKLLDRFFTEAIQLADEKFSYNGREWTLPVICRCEEIDALARSRDSTDEVYGRIQTTALERLDHLADGLGDRLIIFLFTTNTPELCDMAFLRRAGGEIIDFGRIRRPQFHAILAKRIQGLPLHPAQGAEQRQAEQRLCKDVTHWMFSPNGEDPGQVEVTFAGSATSAVKFRRDVLTGAVVDLSVQQACKVAKQLEAQGVEQPGLTTRMLLNAFDEQVRGICDQITERNVGNYLALPPGARVASVRRIEQPALPPYELEREIA